MEEKCLNKVREIHRVKRVVRFNSLDEAMRFSLMYGDLMKDGKPVINKCKGEDFGFTAGFLMKKEDFENIRQQVLIANYPFPVYIDKNSSFKSNNKTLPKDARFHYFLINSRNLPIFVGNPLSNQQLNELFINVLNVINN